jgi:two-component system, LytTR family, response regulator
MKTMIIEDSRLARSTLKDLLTHYPHLELCGEAENPEEALPIIQKETPELLLLDIHMPGKNGFELLEMLDYEPQVIFVTAHADYAIRSFEFATVDYVLKPVSPERFKKAIARLEKISTTHDALNKNGTISTNEFSSTLALENRVLLREGEDCHFVLLKNITYFESLGNYTQVFWDNKSATVLRPLGKIEARLPAQVFFRASRKHIVNMLDVVSVEHWINGGFRLQLKHGNYVEVSRRHASNFKEIFSL